MDAAKWPQRCWSSGSAFLPSVSINQVERDNYYLRRGWAGGGGILWEIRGRYAKGTAETQEFNSTFKQLLMDMQ